MKLHKKHRYWQKQIDKNKNIGSSKPGREAGRGTRETGFASPPLGGCVRQLGIGALHEQVVSTHNIFSVIFLMFKRQFIHKEAKKYHTTSPRLSERT